MSSIIFPQFFLLQEGGLTMNWFWIWTISATALWLVITIAQKIVEKKQKKGQKDDDRNNNDSDRSNN